MMMMMMMMPLDPTIAIAHYYISKSASYTAKRHPAKKPVLPLFN